MNPVEITSYDGEQEYRAREDKIQSFLDVSINKKVRYADPIPEHSGEREKGIELLPVSTN